MRPAAVVCALGRLPIGGMAVQSLWQRSGRTFLTLSVIGLTVGAIMALESIVAGTAQSMTNMISGADVEIMIRQADISDTSLSIIDDRVIDKIAGYALQVKSASGMVFTAVMMPEAWRIFLYLGLRCQMNLPFNDIKWSKVRRLIATIRS